MCVCVWVQTCSKVISSG
uniref:Uncharacterized protein n=1 Tax=Anopheles albimanus TaxID=7167 RepID=A0A182FYW2_ANOAL